MVIEGRVALCAFKDILFRPILEKTIRRAGQREMPSKLNCVNADKRQSLSEDDEDGHHIH